MLAGALTDDSINIESTGSQALTFTDADPTDVHTVTCLRDDLSILPAWITCTLDQALGTVTVAYAPLTADVLVDEDFIIDVYITDDDSDSTGNILTSATQRFTLSAIATPVPPPVIPISVNELP